MHVLLATSWLDPFTHLVAFCINGIDTVVHSRGWSLVIFALVLKVVTWPLNVKQFKAFLKMQQMAPQIKALQDRYKQKDETLKRRYKSENDAAKLKAAQTENQQEQQREMMEMYRKHGANPLAGCWPMLVTYPFFAAVYYAVVLNRPLYEGQGWLWIGSSIAHQSPFFAPWKGTMLASALTAPDLLLLVLYAISMYFFSRYGTVPSTDPQQAQTQKIMAYMMPLMFSYIGFQAKWPSAMVLYWFSFNIFNMLQQFYLLRRYHQPLSVLDNEHPITETAQAPLAAPPVSTNGARRSGQRKKQKGAKT